MTNPLPTRLFKLYAPTLIASRDPVDGKLRIEGVASSSVKDRHGDQLTLKALKKMESSAVGLTIFMNHSYDIPKDVFGTVERTRLTKAADLDPKTGDPIWELRFGIGVASSNPEAVRSFELIETDKIKLGLSIGAMIPEGGATFEKGASPAQSRVIIDDVDLVETSLIGIPANPRAWVDYAVKSFLGVYPDKATPEKHLSILAALASDEDVPAAEPDPEIEPVVVEASADDMIPSEDPVLDLDELEKRAALDFSEFFDDEHFASTTPTLVAEVWSSAYKNALPDSAYACPAQRKYPHHSKSGAVDRAHLANALARQAQGNDSCGHAHLEAHAAKLGMGGREKGAEPDLVADGGGQHPHAHLHEHEHSHGYESNLTTHNHEHAHVHSHEHEGDHEHASDMNDYQHDHQHDGSYDADHAHEGTEEETTKDLTPDITKTRVTVWEDGKTVEVDTGRSKPKSEDVQSAQTSESETAGGLAEGSAGTKALVPLDDDGTEALKLASQTVNDTTGLVRALYAQMVASRSDAAAARDERDAAIEIARKTLQGTKEIIEKIGDLPAGRKTGGIVEVRSEFDALKDIYGDDVRRLMTKKG